MRNRKNLLAIVLSTVCFIHTCILIYVGFPQLLENSINDNLYVFMIFGYGWFLIFSLCLKDSFQPLGTAFTLERGEKVDDLYRVLYFFLALALLVYSIIHVTE